MVAVPAAVVADVRPVPLMVKVRAPAVPVTLIALNVATPLEFVLTVGDVIVLPGRVKVMKALPQGEKVVVREFMSAHWRVEVALRNGR